MKRLSVAVDPKLLEEAMKLVGAKTKREVIEKALRELLKTKALAELRSLAGEGLVDWTEEELIEWRGSAVERMSNQLQR